MVFWRAKKITPGTDEQSAANDTAPVEAAEASNFIEQKPPSEVEDSDSTTSLDFATTNDLEPFTGWLGQDQTVKVLQTAFAPDRAPSNVWVIADAALDVRMPLLATLNKLTKALPPTLDWLAVPRLDGSGIFSCASIKQGQGAGFVRDVARALSELTFTLPTEFASAGYAMRERAILESVDGDRAAALDEFRLKAEAQNIALLRTAAGYALAPLHDGRVVKPALFDQLPKIMRDDVEARVAVLETELAAILKQQPEARRAEYQQLAGLRQAHAKPLVEAAFEQVAKAASQSGDLQNTVRALMAHVIENHDSLTAHPRRGSDAILTDAVMSSYVPSLVTSSTGNTVVEWRSSCNASEQAAISALTQANGGILFIKEGDLDLESAGTRVLREVLASRRLRLEEFAGAEMPWTGRVVLVTSKALQQIILNNEPSFAQVFSLRTECAKTLPSTAANDIVYASWLAALVKQVGMLPLSSAAVGALIEDSTKCAAAKHELSLETIGLLPVLRSADCAARMAGASRIEAAHIETALATGLS